jgi:hypothetical protein
MSLPLLASSTSYPYSINLQDLYTIRLQEAENALSSLILVALLTYFYTAFGKFFKTGGHGRDEICSDQGGK